MKIYLVRHAQKNKIVSRNSRKRIKITGKGELQSKKLGKYLRTIKFNKFVVSPYRRTMETAKVINRYLKMQLEKEPKVEETKVFKYFTSLVTLTLKGGSESEREEFIKLFSKGMGMNQKKLIVTHAGFIRYVTAVFEPRMFKRLFTLLGFYTNTAISIFDISDGKLSVDSYNLHPHLDDDTRTQFPF